MEPSEAIAFVRRYNAWRRNDDDSEMPHPKDIGHAIDALCDHAERIGRELDQERQDRKQADLDAIRALGERNDARAELERRENARTIQAMTPQQRHSLMFGRFFIPSESCPECGNDVSCRDNGDGKVYDGDECRCCECGFVGYLSVDEDGDTLINYYETDDPTRATRADVPTETDR